MELFKKIKITLLILTIIGVVCFSVLLYLLRENPKRDRFLIPEGFSGTLAVTYSVQGAPPLPMEEGFRLIKFNNDGIVQTSSPGMPGKFRDEYYFYSGNARRPLEPKEMGGGSTVTLPNRPEGEFTVTFSVTSSRQAVPVSK